MHCYKYDKKPDGSDETGPAEHALNVVRAPFTRMVECAGLYEAGCDPPVPGTMVSRVNTLSFAPLARERALCATFGEGFMPTGTVKWFDCKKGFGFVLNDEGKDVFVHFSVIEGDGFRSLKDGEVVEYEEVESPKGLLARRVTRVAPARRTPVAQEFAMMSS